MIDNTKGVWKVYCGPPRKSIKEKAYSDMVYWIEAHNGPITAEQKKYLELCLDEKGSLGGQFYRAPSSVSRLARQWSESRP